MEMYYQEDCNQNLLKDKTIAVIGYGSQGHAHAKNLRDSGHKVIIGLYEGSKSLARALKDEFTVTSVKEASRRADLIMVLIPDERQGKVFSEEIQPNLEPGNALVFAHGFNIHFNQIVPPEEIDVFMVAPKGPGHLVRRVYEDGKGVPALYAVYQDHTGQAEALAKAYAAGIGSAQAGVLKTTFKEETETDLFGEQAVLCGGVTELVKAGFDTLTDAGYQPEIAYFECLHELKLIVDLLYEGGFENMRYSISDTAEYGDYMTGKRIVTDRTRFEMRKVLEEIQSGQFAREWLMENQIGRPLFNRVKAKEMEHNIVPVGKKLRKMMTWIEA